ncbi:MAG: HAD hydrolase-like protein, partial [Sphaerochaetaceae bacterium]|nr:HAD hydrolase-like protein [Sphaerochaetaceae bacterium]
MIKYSLVLFDFDGTLMNTSLGIFDTLNYVMKILDREIDENCNINKFIGPPLSVCFSEVMGLEADLVETAMDIYRKRYKEKGQYIAEFYEGIIPLLSWLKTTEMKVAVATLNNAVLAESMASYLGIMSYMDGI